MFSRLASYGIAALGLLLIAIPNIQSAVGQSNPEPSTPTPTESQRKRFKVTVTVQDIEDLKVAEGDRVQPGTIIADRGKDRRRLEAQKKQLELSLARLKSSLPQAPLPPTRVPAIASPTFLEETAAIEKAKVAVEQAQLAMNAKRQELDYLGQVEGLNPLILEHEQANLGELDLELNAAVRDYQLAIGKRSTSEYQHSVSVAQRVDALNDAQLTYQRQLAEYEERLRSRDYQLAQTQLKLDEVNNAIASIAVIKSPYAGRVRRVKWLGQGPNGDLSAEVNLLVRQRDGGGDGVALSQFPARLPGSTD